MKYGVSRSSLERGLWWGNGCPEVRTGDRLWDTLLFWDPEDLARMGSVMSMCASVGGLVLGPHAH